MPLRILLDIRRPVISLIKKTISSLLLLLLLFPLVMLLLLLLSLLLLLLFSYSINAFIHIVSFIILL